MALALDASTPAWVTGTANPVTTASFTPPAGSLLFAICTADTSNTFAVSGGSLTWTPIASLNNGTDGAVATFWAYQPSSVSMTVSSTKTGSFTANALKVLVFTGAETSFTGASTAVATATANVTTTGTNSWVWAGHTDENATLDTAATGCSFNDGPTAYGGIASGILKRTATAPASGTVVNIGTTSNTVPTIVAFEVKEPASVVDPGPDPYETVGYPPGLNFYTRPSPQPWQGSGDPGPPTLVQMAGFEHGSALGMRTGAAGKTHFDFSDGTFGTNITVQNANTRTGTGYACRFTVTSSAQADAYWTASGGSPGNSLPVSSILVGRFWWCPEDLTGAGGADGPAIIHINSSAGGNSFFEYWEATGQLGFTLASGTEVRTPNNTITVGQWYAIDFRVDMSSSTWRGDWRVNGVSQGQVTNSGAKDTITEFRIGCTSLFNIVMSYDDIALSQTATDYPLPDLHISALAINGSGTHSNSGNFNQTTNNGTSLVAISSPETVVDELPPTVSSSADAIAQVTASTSSYLEFTHASITADTIYGVKHIIGGWASSASTTTLAIVLLDGSAIGNTLGTPAAPVNPSYTFSTSTLGWTTKTYARAPSGGNWTVALVNALRTRIGYSDNITAKPGMNAGYLEVASVTAPITNVNAAPAEGAGTGVANNATVIVAPNAGNATGTGTANSPLETVAPNASNAAVTGTANNATVIVTVNDSGATGTGVANDATVVVAEGFSLPSILVAPGLSVFSGVSQPQPWAGTDPENHVFYGQPQEGAGTGTANDATVIITSNASNGAGTGTSNSPLATVAPNGGNAAGTGTANTANTAITINAGVATGTGTANDAIATVAPNAGNAAGTCLINTAPVKLHITLASCDITGTANNGTVAIAVNDSGATGTGTANSPLATVAPNAGNASATGTANNATVAISVNDSGATGTGTANDATGQTIVPVEGYSLPYILVAPGLSPFAGVGQPQPWAGTDPENHVFYGQPQEAAGVGQANDATVIVAPNASNGAGTGTANSPLATVAPNASNAAGTGTANNAIVAESVNASVASGTGTANSATVTVASNAGNATATGTANNALAAIAVNAGVATGTGTANSPLATVAPNAGNGAGTGTANNALAAISVNDSGATGTGTAYDVSQGIVLEGYSLPYILVAPGLSQFSGVGQPQPWAGTDSAVATVTNVSATEATGTGTANDATVTVAPNAGNATGTGTANSATATVAPNASNAASTGVANSPLATVAPNASASTGTGTANGGTATVAPNTGNAAGTGTANSSTITVAPNAGNAASTGTANSGTIAETVNAGSGAGTGTANSPLETVAPNATVATATGTANDATVAITVNATEATATGTAYDVAQGITVEGYSLPYILVAPGLSPFAGVGQPQPWAGSDAEVRVFTIVNAGVATATGTANDAIAKVAPNAENVTGTGTANDVSATIKANTSNASGVGAGQNAAASVTTAPGNGTGTGTANDPVPAVRVNAGVATGTGAANGATVSDTANAGSAASTGTANSAVAGIKVNAGVATGTGTAYQPVVNTTGHTNAPAQPATVTGTANNATIRITFSAQNASATGNSITLISVIKPNAQPALVAVGDVTDQSAIGEPGQSSRMHENTSPYLPIRRSNNNNWRW